MVNMAIVLLLSHYIRCGAPAVEPCTAEAEPGTTDAYAPSVGLIATDQYETVMLAGDDQDYIDSDIAFDCGLLFGEV